jgi:hypothetical protein
VRSDPPRPSVVTRAVGRSADEPGHDGRLAPRQERPEHAPRAPRGAGESGCRAAVMAVGLDEVEGVDEAPRGVRSASTAARIAADTRSPREASRSLAVARDGPVRRRRSPGRGTHARPRPSTASSRRRAAPAGTIRSRVTWRMTCQKRWPRPGGGLRPALAARRRRRAADPSRRPAPSHDDERDRMFRDERGGLADGGAVRE